MTAPECTCTPYPSGTGPEVDCPEHGLDAETMRWLKVVGLSQVGSHAELGQWLADRDSQVTWSVWMLFPGEAGGGWSRIAAGLTQVEAERFAAALLFRGRAMADKEEE